MAAASAWRVDDDRLKMQSMQAELEDLRKTMAEANSASAEPTNTAAVQQLQQAVTQIRDEQEVITSQVQQP